ncbi:MAG: hypothetical protein P8X51_03280 [Maritimibacter sp.]
MHARAQLFGQRGDRLAVTFLHLRGGREGFVAPRPVNRYLAQGIDHLQVQTAEDDWYLNDDLPALRQALAALTETYRQVGAIGFSMGGYGALLLSRSLRLGQSLLVSPQSTPFSDMAPFDPRFEEHEGKCRRDLALSAADISPEMRGFVLYDPRHPSADTAHANIIAAMAPRLALVAMPFGGHPCTAPIWEAGLWGSFQDMLFKPRLTTAHLADIRRQARESSPSWNRYAGVALLDRETRREDASGLLDKAFAPGAHYAKGGEDFTRL